MVFGQSHVFVHVEGHDAVEGDLARAVERDELAVQAEWRGAGREAEHETGLAP
jgi:hypothetical protein